MSAKCSLKIGAFNWTWSWHTARSLTCNYEIHTATDRTGSAAGYIVWFTCCASSSLCWILCAMWLLASTMEWRTAHQTLQVENTIHTRQFTYPPAPILNSQYQISMSLHKWVRNREHLLLFTTLIQHSTTLRFLISSEQLLFIGFIILVAMHFSTIF